MKIYTKKGDAGHTELYGGKAISKSDIRIRAYGTLDELNAVFGLILAEESLPAVQQALLQAIQGELFALGTELATVGAKTTAAPKLGDDHIQVLENAIDEMEDGLPQLKNFILPGGNRVSSLLHLARTVCRRAEREVVALHLVEELRPQVLIYLNRLSDLLFVCARMTQNLAGLPEIIWNPRR